MEFERVGVGRLINMTGYRMDGAVRLFKMRKIELKKTAEYLILILQVFQKGGNAPGPAGGQLLCVQRRHERLSVLARIKEGVELRRAGAKGILHNFSILFTARVGRFIGQHKNVKEIMDVPRFLHKLDLQESLSFHYFKKSTLEFTMSVAVYHGNGTLSIIFSIEIVKYHHFINVNSGLYNGH